jgi:hypothetical protein
MIRYTPAQRTHKSIDSPLHLMFKKKPARITGFAHAILRFDNHPFPHPSVSRNALDRQRIGKNLNAAM